jgi:hypothetical protein
MEIIPFIEGIGQKRGNRLIKFGITTLEDLRRMDIDVVAQATGLSRRRLRKYKAMAELQTIEAIDHQIAEALVCKGGIHNLEMLASLNAIDIAKVIRDGIDANIISDDYLALGLADFDAWLGQAQYYLSNEGAMPRPNGLGGFMVVRPSLGQPLLLSVDGLDAFDITVAGGWTDSADHNPPSPDEIRANLVGVRLSCSAREGRFSQPLRIIEVHQRVIYDEIEPNIHNTCTAPYRSRHYQYLAGYRWECRVTVGLEMGEVSPPENAWPAMCDIEYLGGVVYHAISVSTPLSYLDLKILHVTDSHVAGRNDQVRDFFLDLIYLEPWEQKLFEVRYRNYNDNLRAVIQYANERWAAGDLDLIVLTGDVVDHIYDGYFDFGRDKYYYGYRTFATDDADRARSNFEVFVDIITGRDARGEELRVPIYVVPGNHDYYKHEPLMALDLKTDPQWWLKCLAGLAGRSVASTYEQDAKVDRGHSWQLSKRECLQFDAWKQGEAYDEIPLDEPVVPLGDAFKFLASSVFDFARTYLPAISYDVNYRFHVGWHQFVALNTGFDIGMPSENRIYMVEGDFSQYNVLEQRFLGDHVLGWGYSVEHDELLQAARSAAREEGGEYGTVFMLHHAPIIHEKQEREYHGPICVQQLDTLQWMLPPCNLDYDIGLAMGRTLGNDGKRVHVSLCGHTHDTSEYRIRVFPDEHGTTDDVGFYARRYSDEIAENIDRNWLQRHHPLSLLSGSLKARHPRVRELDIYAFGLRRQEMNNFVPRLGQTRTAGPMACFVSGTAGDFSSLGFRADVRNSCAPQFRYDTALHADWRLAMSDIASHFREIISVGEATTSLIFASLMPVIVGSREEQKRIFHIRQVCDRLGIEYDDDDGYVDLFSNQLTQITHKVYYAVLDSLGYESMDEMPEELRQRQFLPSICFAAAFKRWLNRFGLNPSAGTDALDPVYVLQHDCELYQGLYGCVDRDIVALFEYAEADPLNPFRLWFAMESSYLAEYGGYAEDYRNSADPSVHLSFCPEHSAEEILNEVMDRYHLQVDRLLLQGGMESVRRFYGESAARLNAWSAFSGALQDADNLTDWVEQQGWDAERIKMDQSAKIALIVERMVPVVHVPEPQLHTSKALLDFGLQGVGRSPRTDSFSITNEGDAPLTIHALELVGSYRFSAPVTTPWQIFPHGREPLFIDIEQIELGANDGMLTIHSDDPNEPTKHIPLYCIGVHWFYVGAGEVEFGQVPIHRQKDLSVVISNKGPEELIVDRIEVSGGSFSIGLSAPLIIAGDSHGMVPVTFRPTAITDFTGELTVECSAYIERPVVNIVLHGDGVDWFRVDPESIDFGRIPEGQMSDPISLKVMNNHTESVTITGLKLFVDPQATGIFTLLMPTGDDYDITIGSDASFDLGIVRAYPSNQGVFVGNLNIGYCAADSTRGTKSVPLRVEGV